MNLPRVCFLGQLLLVCCACARSNSASLDASAQPSASPSFSASSAGSGSFPAAFTGKPEKASDPLAGLKARTYVATAVDDVVYAGTTAGVVAWSFHDKKKPVELASVVLPGSVSGVTLFGPSNRILGISTGPTGLALVDASNVSKGRLDRLSDTPWKASDRGGCHSVWSMAIADGDNAFLACGTGGVARADLHDHAHPAVVRSMDVDGYVRDVATLDQASGVPAAKASSSRIAIAAGQAGLVVAEFPPQGNPRSLARLATQGESRSLQVKGGIAYIADGPAGLRIVDLRDPTRPAELGRLDPHTTDMTRGVAITGNTAVVCLGDSGLITVDVSDPHTPKQLGKIDPRRAVNRAMAVGSLVYAANDAGGILLLDVGKPQTISLIYSSDSTQ